MLASPSHSAIYKWKDENGKTHFTDSLSKVPPQFRKKGELKTMKGAPAEPSNPVALLLPKQKGTAHVIKAKSVRGGHYVVEVLINGTVSADFIVDTGASMVVLSERIGKRLGVYYNTQLPTIGMSTAGGKVEAPLFVLDSLKIGDAEVFAVEASTNPHMEGMDGLLGMTFLSAFKVEMDQQNAEMILKPLGDPGDTLWDGKNETWWKKKYETYAGALRQLERAAYKARGNMQETVKIKKFTDHYEKLHRLLEQRANRFNLPKEYRSYP
ncbi:MAG: TIGR02281 family clan AA aspartic protease [Nitrospinota bacterium]|nr:TIGR02281 family clan AA aspartic protease [Nitrospinota bacterium]